MRHCQTGGKITVFCFELAEFNLQLLYLILLVQKSSEDIEACIKFFLCVKFGQESLMLCGIICI